MTSERKLLFEASDIQGIEFACTECHAVLRLDPRRERHHAPSRCPSCGKDWLAVEGSQLDDTMRALFRALRVLRETEKGTPFLVRFDVAAPDGSSALPQ